ncbi:hypothetical protein [Rhodopirellula sp. P2]|uniref:hypothetical protein n=1 Tax=Rhodopirellula sp. P2 TaxID=2127060 RepID=UPI002367D412|nr:hypothetical protein [Rhodopirellula sp. P2]WDQ18800.1 hypothetical protein PSR62_09705 [Rhodopirellula sp. P2]
MSVLNRCVLNRCVVSLALPAFLLVVVANPTNAQAQDAATAKPVTVDVFGAGSLEVPASFKKTTPRSRIIEHEFSIQEGEGDDAPSARMTMMAAGGDVKANLERWKNQFSGSDKKIGESEEKKQGDWQTHVIEISGNFSETMGGGPFSGGRVVKREDYGMLGAILVHPEGRKYFVKMIGPRTLIESNRDAFKKMIASIGE